MRRVLRLLPLLVVGSLFALGVLAISPVGAAAATAATAASPSLAPPGPGEPCGTLSFQIFDTPAYDFSCGNQADLPERWGIESYQMYTDLGSAPTNAWNVVLNGLASTVFELCAVIGAIVVSLVAYIFEIDLVSVFEAPASTVGGELERALGGAMATVAFVFALAQVLRGRWRRDHRRVFEIFGVSVLCLGLTGFWAANPTFMARQIDALGNSLNYSAAGLFSAGDPLYQQQIGLPEYAGGPTSFAAIRMYQDTYWRTFVFDPWLTATFDDNAVGYACATSSVGQGSSLGTVTSPPGNAVFGWGGGGRTYTGVQSDPAVAPGTCPQSGGVTIADLVLAYNAGSAAAQQQAASSQPSGSSSAGTDPAQRAVESGAAQAAGGGSSGGSPEAAYLEGYSPGFRLVVGLGTLPGVALSLVIIGGLALARFGAEMGLLALTVIAPFVFMWSMATASLRWVRWFFVSAVAFGLIQFAAPIAVLLLLELMQLLAQAANVRTLPTDLWWLLPLFNALVLVLLIRFRRPLTSTVAAGLHLNPAIHSALSLPERLARRPAPREQVTPADLEGVLSQTRSRRLGLGGTGSGSLAGDLDPGALVLRYANTDPKGPPVLVVAAGSQAPLREHDAGSASEGAEPPGRPIGGADAVRGAGPPLAVETAPEAPAPLRRSPNRMAGPALVRYYRQRSARPRNAAEDGAAGPIRRPPQELVAHFKRRTSTAGGTATASAAAEPPPRHP